MCVKWSTCGSSTSTTYLLQHVNGQAIVAFHKPIRREVGVQAEPGLVVDAKLQDDSTVTGARGTGVHGHHGRDQHGVVRHSKPFRFFW